MSSVTFRSKLDGWVAGSLLSGSIVQIVALIVVAIAAPKALLVVVPLVLLISASVVWLYFATRYVVTERLLLIRGGIINVDVPLDQVTSVEATRNPMSAPAWSLDRLLICYGQGRSCMISPKDKARFVSVLRERGVRVA